MMMNRFFILMLQRDFKDTQSIVLKNDFMMLWCCDDRIQGWIPCCWIRALVNFLHQFLLLCNLDRSKIANTSISDMSQENIGSIQKFCYK